MKLCESCGQDFDDKLASWACPHYELDHWGGGVREHTASTLVDPVEALRRQLERQVPGHSFLCWTYGGNTLHVAQRREDAHLNLTVPEFFGNFKIVVEEAR